MKDPTNPNEEKAATSDAQGEQGHADRPSGQDRQEQYQRTREHAARGQEEQDREARIRRRAHEIWEQEGHPEGLADQHWERAAQDLDREDAAIRREGNAGEKPGVKATQTPESKKSDPDRT